MQRVVPTEARGDAELVLWDGSEFGHLDRNGSAAVFRKWVIILSSSSTP